MEHIASWTHSTGRNYFTYEDWTLLVVLLAALSCDNVRSNPDHPHVQEVTNHRID